MVAQIDAAPLDFSAAGWQGSQEIPGLLLEPSSIHLTNHGRGQLATLQHGLQVGPAPRHVLQHTASLDGAVLDRQGPGEHYSA